MCKSIIMQFALVAVAACGFQEHEIAECDRGESVGDGGVCVDVVDYDIVCEEQWSDVYCYGADVQKYDTIDDGETLRITCIWMDAAYDDKQHVCVDVTFVAAHDECYSVHGDYVSPGYMCST